MRIAPRPTGVVLATLSLLSVPAPAQAVDFSQTVCFGDSLTHNNLLGWPFRTSLYGDDPMEAVFAKASAAGDTLTSYAVAGAEASLALAQIGAYALRYVAGGQGLGTLVQYEFGGNDVLNDWNLLSGSPPGTDPAADARISRLIGTMAYDLSLLWWAHPRARLVVWTIPDVTYTPEHWADRNTVRGANVRAHLARVNGLLRQLDGLANVVVLDTEVLIRELATNPPVVGGQQLLGPPSYGWYAGLFADRIHPTAVANAIVANAIIDRIAAKWGASIPKYGDAELAALARIR